MGLASYPSRREYSNRAASHYYVCNKVALLHDYFNTSFVTKVIPVTIISLITKI